MIVSVCLSVYVCVCMCVCVCVLCLCVCVCACACMHARVYFNNTCITHAIVIRGIRNEHPSSC